MSIRDLVDGVQLSDSIEDLDKVLAADIDPAAVATPTPNPDEGDPNNSGDPLVGTKFEGKSATEVVEMYKNLEQVQGRTANELGTQRQLTDQLLNLKRTDDLGNNTGQPTPAELPKINSSALVDDPDGTLDAYVSAREAKLLDKLETRLNSLEGTLVGGQFNQRHPDAETIANSSEFATWVSKSKLRQTAAAAAAGGNYEVADLLLDEYKQETSSTESTTPQSDDASQVALETTTVAEGAAATGKDTTIYSRSKLMQLRLNKPDVYRRPDFQAKVAQAYAEDRVR